MKPQAPTGRGPDGPRALAQYRRRAHFYDAELLAFEPIRVQAVSQLQLRPGDTVLDVGSGTGLSFGRLRAQVGEAGRIVAIEQSPEMMQLARKKAAVQGRGDIDFLLAPAARARIRGQADAALFHFTHDILQDEAAIANVFAHLKPGARVVAAGLQWAAPWAWPANGFVMMAALYSTTSLDGLGQPWARLEPRLAGFRVRQAAMGIYVAAGEVAVNSP